MNADGDRNISVVMTVKNDAAGCRITLESLLRQTLCPAEIIVVDGGSTDATPDVVQEFAERSDRIRLIRTAGANIAAGRNIGTRAAQSDIIATIDAGCRAEPTWLERLHAPFRDDPATQFVAGIYRIEPYSLLEQIAGLATMRGQLEPIDPQSFNPSARSLAYTRELWRKAGGWPEWLGFSEDTLFDYRVRHMRAAWRVAQEAVVHWRPRTTLRAVARQFYHYGTGRGHTQIDAAAFRYHLRNLGALIGLAIACEWSRWFCLPLIGGLLYFYWYGNHDKARRVAKHSGRLLAYPLCLVVLGVVTVSHVVGYLRGTFERWCDRRRYVLEMERYLADGGQGFA